MRLAPWPRPCVAADSSTPPPPGSSWSPAAPTPPARPPALPRRSGPPSVHALHVNYGLRESADRDERICRDLCSRLRIDLHIERPRELAGNLQAAARDARYAAAEQLRARTGGNWIATGHTRTDLAETVLYRLAVSPGARALRGLPAQQRPRGAAAAGARARRDAPPRRRGRPAVRRRRDQPRARLRPQPSARRGAAGAARVELGGRAEHRRDPGRAGRGGPSAGAGRARGAGGRRRRRRRGGDPGRRPAGLGARSAPPGAAGARRARHRAGGAARTAARGRDHAAGRASRGRRRSTSATACGRSASTG